MKCAHCNQPVREAKWWEKLLMPIAYLSELVHGTCYIHTSKPESGYASTFPLSNMPKDEYEDVCSNYVFQNDPGIV